MIFKIHSTIWSAMNGLHDITIHSCFAIWKLMNRHWSWRILERSKPLCYFWSPNNNGFKKKRTISCHNKHNCHSLLRSFSPLLFFFSVNCFSGKVLKKSLSSSRFSIFCGWYPWHNSSNCLIQALIVVVEKSSASPHNYFSRTP